MQFKIIGTGSDGNCYLFHESNQYLVIEAGLPFAKLNIEIQAKISKVQAVLISHEHGDHAGYANDYAKRGIKVYSSFETIEQIKGRTAQMYSIEKFKRYSFGVFSVVPIPVEHNAANPFCFLISTPEGGLTFFATDLMSVPGVLPPELNHILIEANYCEEVFYRANFDGITTHGTVNHLSVQKAAKAVNSCESNAIRNVILLHGSNRMSSSDFEMISHFNNPDVVSVGRNKHTYNLNKDPF